MHGPAIPIGLPLLVLVGSFLWKDAARSGSMAENDDGLSDPDEATYAKPLAASGSADADADD